MKGKMWAASLMSAGLATLITAKVVERVMLSELDAQVEAEVAASVRILEKRLEDEMIELAGDEKPVEEDIDEAKRKVFGTRVSTEKPPLSEVVGKNQKVRYDKVLTEAGYSAEEIDDDAQAPGETLNAEIYSITTEEFMSNESDYSQSTVTYYADGGVLDEDNELVIDSELLIGAGRPPFGSNSGEKHIVYIRNDKLRREFEVIEDHQKAADILADPAETL